MTPQPTTFQELIGIFTDLVATAIPVIAGLAVLAFVWGLVKFIANVSGDEKAIREGKNLMIWGLVALFLMFSVWGILAFFAGEFGFNFGLPLLPE